MEWEFVNIESLVPQDHLLRKIDRVIDFDFIRGKVEHLYCLDNGRPAIDPVMLFEMIFIGYLFGIRSERRLVQDIEVNVAYKWFLGLKLGGKVPDSSTLSQNRRRRFNSSEVYREIFDEIVFLAINKGLADGKNLFTDSTHLKANANRNKFVREQVARSTVDYIADLDADVEKDRENHGKKPLKERETEVKTKETRVSTTDPESGFMTREGKPEGFFYLDNRSVDGRHAIITDSYVTPGNVHDSIPYLDRLDDQRERFGFEVEAVGLDAGYNTVGICRGLEERGIMGVIGYRRPTPTQLGNRKQFKYDSVGDCYICPMGERLEYSTTNRDGYREYKSNPNICSSCEYLSRCTNSKNKTRVIARHIWQDAKDRVNANRLTEIGREIYARRKETVERSFADAKELHGHRYARMRGIRKVQEQCLLAAACQNMKKIALIVWKMLNPTDNNDCFCLKTILRALFSFRRLTKTQNWTISADLRLQSSISA